MRQGRTRAAILQHQDCQGRLRRILREEATILCDLWDGARAREDTGARGISHAPADTAGTPRAERQIRTPTPLPLF
eukprot:2842897-Alexandrium_andersonii.AAC.1